MFSLKVQPRHLITVEPFSDPVLDLCHDSRPLRSNNRDAPAGSVLMPTEATPTGILPLRVIGSKMATTLRGDNANRRAEITA